MHFNIIAMVYTHPDQYTHLPTYIQTYLAYTYGAPFVACTLLLTEANFVQQKSLLSNKSHFCLTKVILSMTKEILSTTKLLLSDKS